MENSEKMLRGRNTRVFQTPTRTTFGVVGDLRCLSPLPARHSSDPPPSCTPSSSLPPSPPVFCRSKKAVTQFYLPKHPPSFQPGSRTPQDLHHGPLDSLLHYLQTLSASQNPYSGSQGGSHSAPEKEKKGTQFTLQGLKNTTKSIFSHMACCPLTGSPKTLLGPTSLAHSRHFFSVDTYPEKQSCLLLAMG